MGILIVLISLFVLKTKWDTLVEFLAQYKLLCAQSSYLVNSKSSIHFIVMIMYFSATNAVILGIIGRSVE